MIFDITNQNLKDIAFTLVNYAWRLISGPLMMLLIPLYLSAEQQGYWYLFGSISALSVFADLGFSNIILQFSAHEFAFLSFNDNKELEGDSEHLNKLASFFNFSLKWLSSICAFVFPIIYVVGIAFFVRDSVAKIYLLPWTIYSIGSLLNFFNYSVLSFIEGLNNIASVQKIRFRVAVINSVVVISLLLLHGNIYALAFSMLVSASSIFISLFGTYKKVLTQLLKISKVYFYPWRKEVMPLFFRYALSFSSGYFIFQIYTPLMHYFHGAEYSGKVGISLSLVTAIFSVANIWCYTVIPRINMLISKQDWDDLDNLFKKRLLLSVLTYIFITVCMFIFVALFGKYWVFPKIISRFLSLPSIITLLLCYLIQVIVNAMAVYLRGHKQEPYMVISVISAIVIAISTCLIGKF